MIEKLAFGRTGHLSTRTLFGAAALGSVSQDDADRTLDVLLEYGVNHIDTAASYGDSELRIGPWMDQHRKNFFLATKTGERSYDKARDQGLTRFIGVTGHDVTVAAMHKRSLERFDFDSVLLPYNFTMMQNPQYVSEFEDVVAICQQRNVAVQTIKSLSRGAWSEHAPHTASTWYEPFFEQPQIDHTVHWVLGRPGLFLNTPGDIHLLPKVLDAASRYEHRPSDAEMQADVDALGVKPLFV